MKKTLLFAATALAMLASCSQSDDLNNAPVVAETNQAVEFSTYVGKTPVTRAGTPGSITDDGANGTQTLKSVGFGVFGFYTDGTPYAADQASTKPNFMYNERIYWNESGTGVSKWEYSPIKFWPNEFANGNVDDQADPAATGAAQHGLVSFFAYAPYVSEETVWASETSGITSMSAKTLQENPTITYTMAKNGDIVDLLWGTAGTNGVTATGSAQAGTTLSDATEVKRDGTTHYVVNADLNKMKTEGKVEFLFKHALAKVGGSQVGAGTKNGLSVILDVNSVGFAEKGEDKPTATKVTIKDITIECTGMDIKKEYIDPVPGTDETGKILNSGVFDLATGKWKYTSSDYADPVLSGVGANIYKHIIAAEGSTSLWSTKDAEINASLAEPTTAQIASDWTKIPDGVLSTTATNVYKNETNPLVFFPGTKPKLKFNITYVVRTKDPKLDGGWSEVEQNITKTVTFGEYVKLNNQYNILMHLGITGVKFTATVSDWEIDGTDTDGDGIANATEVNLPINVQ